MKFTQAVNILSKRFGVDLGNKRKEIKEYVKEHPEDKMITEVFDVYIRVAGMPVLSKENSGKNSRANAKTSMKKPKNMKYVGYKKWFLFDTLTGEKKEFDSSEEISVYLNCAASTVRDVRLKNKLLLKRYKVAASR